MAAADPGLTLCPDAYLRTLTVPPTPSRARRQPVGVARLTSRMKWYPRVIDGTSYATGYIDTFVPGTERAGHHEPMYTALKGTLHRMSGADCVVQLEVEDHAYVEQNAREMFALANDPATGKARLMAADDKSAPVPNCPDWHAAKTTCLDNMTAFQPSDPEIYMKPARAGLKVVTLREEFDDDPDSGSQTKQVLLRSPAMNRQKGVTMATLAGRAVDLIVTIKYRVVLNLTEKTSALRCDIYISSAYVTEQATNAADDDPAVEGFERAHDYEEELNRVFATPERGEQRRRESDDEFEVVNCAT
jgi:hypothetical protein